MDADCERKNMLMDEQSPKPGTGVTRFSTDGFPKQKRIAMWLEMRSQIVKLDFRPVSESIRFAGTGMALPGLGIVASEISPLRIARTRHTMLDGNDNIRLLMLRSGRPAKVTHLGRELSLDPGCAVALSNCDLNTVIFTASQSRMVSLNLTRNILRPLLSDFDAIFAHTISDQIGALRLLMNYIDSLLGQPASPTSELQQLVVTHVYDLAALAMGAMRDAIPIANTRGLRAARMREIKSDITANLWRESLAIDQIATRQGITPRYIQLMFEQEGTTFTKFLLSARLDRARRMLLDQRLADRSISAIAFAVGFGDLSYFNKSFRRRFGGTPSDIRAINKLADL
jgi:AraC-like DNA-binding protein